MSEITVELQWLDPERCTDLNLPAYASEQASGMDVAACLTTSLSLEPGAIALIPTGFAVALPAGYEMQVRPRSGLAIKHGITVVNAPGTIDADYRGEVKIGLINHGTKPFVINRGDRIAQLVIAEVSRARVTPVRQLNTTVRGTGGFGHTGI
ncbi:MAG: dUTP diphosphatase [Desulfobulbus propionicus]|nr:MAG: dUTP diphosphatase [Desulfobulbus propionicus]